ncbi:MULTISPECIES: CC0125/CC1285 family lipoprotein [Rhodanobacter]|uniref:CC0125/CC1285 family lipoprotein n=1 Tax=Rhodanobacter TaxID=75309 RepID=UPI0011FFFC56|nr:MULTISPECIES: hypothetical protein [Rhodanobacter]TAN18793.1 MAG: hypothetical protein EPN35_03190 [Rhodanobacter sp.]UJJ55012.1 hypothetical protein LRK53_00980 [Rhodanobacter thiooxydans]
MITKELALRAAALVAAVLVGGCATAYQPKSFTGGFSETDLGPTSFKIGFSGNGFTSPERASDFALLRAADKSIEDGCSYFSVINEAEGGSTSSFTTSTATFGRHSAWGSSFTTPIFKPNSALLVRCFTNQAAGTSLFDAHFVAHSIRTKYHLPETSSQATNPAATNATSNMATTSSQSDSTAQVAMSPPTTNIAQQVLAAQRVARGQGCGDVSEAQDGTFEATCAAGTLIVQCDGDRCIPIRMKNN